MYPSTIGTGLTVARPPVIRVEPGLEHRIRLMSDLHVGSSIVDYPAIEEELADADGRGEDIWLGGDIFDAVLPGDPKRFSPAALHPRLQGRADILNVALDMAEELLSPYAASIRGIGVGNHETAVERRHSFDLVRELIGRLQSRAGAKIAYLGYTGLIEYRYVYGSKNSRPKRFRIFYHHGASKSAVLPSSVAAVAKKLAWVRADVIWEGHTHARWTAEEAVMVWPEGKSRPEVRPVRLVVTGSYMRPYVPQTQASIRQHGRRGNYASDMGHVPHGLGGSQIELRFGGRADPLKVKVVQ